MESYNYTILDFALMIALLNAQGAKSRKYRNLCNRIYARADDFTKPYIDRMLRFKNPEIFVNAFLDNLGDLHDG